MTTKKQARELLEAERSRKAASTLRAAAEAAEEVRDGDAVRYWCEWCGDDFPGEYTTDPSKLPNCGLCGRAAQSRFDEGDENEIPLSVYPMGRKSEFVRRIRMAKAAATKEAAPKREKKEKVAKPCACGCGSETFGTWTVGHDAKFHGAERRLIAGKLEAAEFRKMFPAKAIEAMASADTKKALAKK